MEVNIASHRVSIYSITEWAVPTLSDDEAKKTWELHYVDHPDDRLVVGHLDDNRLNFNIRNLQKIPTMLNMYSNKSYPNRSKSKKVG